MGEVKNEILKTVKSEVKKSNCLKYIKTFETFRNVVSKVKDFFIPEDKWADIDKFERIVSIVEKPPFPDSVTILRKDNNKIEARIVGSYVVADKELMQVSVDHNILKLGNDNVKRANTNYLFNILNRI